MGLFQLRWVDPVPTEVSMVPTEYWSYETGETDGREPWNTGKCWTTYNFRKLTSTVMKCDVFNFIFSTLKDKVSLFTHQKLFGKHNFVLFYRLRFYIPDDPLAKYGISYEFNCPKSTQKNSTSTNYAYILLSTVIIHWYIKYHKMMQLKKSSVIKELNFILHVGCQNLKNIKKIYIYILYIQLYTNVEFLFAVLSVKRKAFFSWVQWNKLTLAFRAFHWQFIKGSIHYIFFQQL